MHYDGAMTSRRHFGSVRRRSSGRYEASYWLNGVRYTGPQTFVAKADAQAWLSGVETDVHRGGWVDPRSGRITFALFAEKWLESRTDLRPRSVLVYQSHLRQHLVPTFGSLPLADVESSQVRSWYFKLLSTKPGAAPGAYRLLRAIFNAAVEDEILLRTPCRVPKGGTDRAVERPMLTTAEVRALTDAMPEDLRAAIDLAAWGGLRRGEVLALRRKDLDPMRNLVRVERAQVELNDGRILFANPKTDAGIRSVHLPAQAMRAIEEHLGRFVDAPADSLLFTGSSGAPLRPKTLTTAFAAARRACGLPQVHFHDLRHFSLTMAAMTGASTKELMRRGGHASPAAALRYQHATEDRDRAIAEALDQLAQGTVIPIDSDPTGNRSRPQRARRGRGET
jgi:integrase